MTATSRFGFLSDEERVAERGPAAVARVRRAMALDGTAHLFRAANVLALALFHARRVEAAAEVSRHAVECGQRLAARPGEEAVLFHVFQPQINLLRFEGCAGDADLALAGLAGLDELAEGRPAQVGELTFDAGAVSAAVDAGYPLPALAGTVRMVDTCKILLRCGRHDELLDFAARYPADCYPAGGCPAVGGGTGAAAGAGAPARGLCHPGATAGPGHAAEAPWLVSPLDFPTPDPRDLPDLPRDQARLGFARAVHTAAALDPRAAGRIIRGLTEVRDLLNQGPWLSELTPTRCLLSLAETASRCGLDGIVHTLALEARTDAAYAGDHLLAAEADALLKGRPRPDPAPFAATPADGPDSLDATKDALQERLEDSSRGC